MQNSVTVLLLDDNEIIADCIEKRLLKASQTFLETTQVEILPIHLKIDNSNPVKAGKEIENYLKENHIDFLLLDRGFFDIIDPEIVNDELLDPDTLYIRRDAKSVKVTEILENVNFGKIKGLKGVILYTYDEPSHTSKWYVEPAKIKQELKRSLQNKVSSDFIDIVLTNSEIYHLASLKLYDPNPKQVGDYLFQGKKSDFKLYGLFMGEILYHRILKLFDKQQNRFLKLKKGKVKTKLVLLFIIFTSLSIGGNTIYSIFIKKIDSDLELFLFSIVFSLLFPALILTLKPHWIIDLEDDGKQIF